MCDHFGRPEHIANLPGLGAHPHLEAARRPMRVELMDEARARAQVLEDGQVYR